MKPMKKTLAEIKAEKVEKLLGLLETLRLDSANSVDFYLKNPCPSHPWTLMPGVASENAPLWRDNTHYWTLYI